MIKTLSRRFKQCLRSLNMLTVERCSETVGFNLTTRDSYFTTLVEVFTNRVLAENTSFTNNVE